MNDVPNFGWPGTRTKYSYDAINRITSIAYSLNGATEQTLSFTYDQGSYGIGHLTGASDANHSVSFTYDSLGEMTGMSQTVGGVSRSVSYAYGNGNLTSIITPSGQIVVYGYNANHQVTSVTVNGTTVLANASYEPFGAVDGWTWGNGTSFSRLFNGDGLVTGISSPGMGESLTYDDASRIVGISNTVSGTSSWAYGYDQLDRLTTATSSSITQGWTYDANGNRLSETGNFYPSTYSISPTNNQITQITGAIAGTASYDAMGNLTSVGGPTYNYNARGRLSSVDYPGGYTESLTYDAFGRLILANGVSANESLVYDQIGHLLGEYDGSGNLIQETVWLGDIPVATLQPNGSGGANIYYVHTDQLSTPRAVTRPSDNAIVWQWNSDPFGYTAPNENPSGLGTFLYNLRFPGQILVFNGARTYDAIIGGYDQSDPMGLQGGSFSTYAYVNADPLSLTDPSGTNPGDSFPSAEAAAVDAFNYINTLRDCHTHEYAGWVYKEWSLFGPPTYTYDEPQELGPAGGVMPPKPTFHDTYAMFHNHPPLPGYDSDNYSPADEDTADYLNIPSYLEIPSGLIKQYIPKPGHPRGGAVATVGKTSCSCKVQ